MLWSVLCAGHCAHRLAYYLLQGKDFFTCLQAPARLVEVNTPAVEKCCRVLGHLLRAARRQGQPQRNTSVAGVLLAQRELWLSEHDKAEDLP